MAAGTIVSLTGAYLSECYANLDTVSADFCGALSVCFNVHLAVRLAPLVNPTASN